MLTTSDVGRYVGVHPCITKKWQARIFIGRHGHSLGYYHCMIDAAKAYDEACIWKVDFMLYSLSLNNISSLWETPWIFDNGSFWSLFYKCDMLLCLWRIWEWVYRPLIACVFVYICVMHAASSMAACTLKRACCRKKAQSPNLTSKTAWPNVNLQGKLPVNYPGNCYDEARIRAHATLEEFVSQIRLKARSMTSSKQASM